AVVVPLAPGGMGYVDGVPPSPSVSQLDDATRRSREYRGPAHGKYIRRHVDPAPASPLVVGVGQLRWRHTLDRHHQRMRPEIRGVRSEHRAHVERDYATIRIRPGYDHGACLPRRRVTRRADIDARRRAD